MTDTIMRVEARQRGTSNGFILAAFRAALAGKRVLVVTANGAVKMELVCPDNGLKEG